VLRVKLGYLDRWNAARAAHAGMYRRLLGGTGVELPMQATYADPVWHLFVIRTTMRNELREHLSGLGIATGIHYPIPIHLQPAYHDLGYNAGDFPVTERCADEILSLPMYPELSTELIEYVAAAVRSFMSSERERVA